MAHGDNGFDQGGAVLVGEHGVHKGLVDFDNINGQFLKQAQRGIAGTEIIQENRDAGIGQGL